MDGGRCKFLVWAPFCERVELHLVTPEDRLEPMTRDEKGYFSIILDGIGAGARYFYRLDGERDRPDPASRYQPEGVHGPSEVVDPDTFSWSDAAWSGRAQEDLVFYELHVGAFTDEGTFDAVIPHLDGLRDLGITAIEIMPVNQFPGRRNWGYDGIGLFAVQNSYGGPEGFKRLIDACHERELCVFLDIVYNHLGPEGNYLGEFGPYFTNAYNTPWGAAVNFDDRDSPEVRRFFLQNALQWVDEYHLDGFRLDAIHAIRDTSPVPFLREMTTGVRRHGARLGRVVQVIAESNRDDPRVVYPAELGGLAFDGEWSDDFHHALHAFLTGENSGYYRDFGAFNDITTAMRSGYVYFGRYMSFLGRIHGDLPRLYNGKNFVVFAQNHDQIGNRAQGDRLSTMIPFEMQKAVAGFVTLSPYLPMYFMGEEYGETAPFQYFVDHGDPELNDAVREGRRQEFETFAWQDDVPDPVAEETFERSKLDRDLLQEPRHQALRDLHRELLRLRREHPALVRLEHHLQDVISYQADRIIFTRRRSDYGDACCVFSLGKDPAVALIPLPAGAWRAALDSTDERWCGPGSKLAGTITSDGEVPVMIPPMSCVVFVEADRD